MTATLGKLTPGHANYFENEVAKGREDYYAGQGEEPGQWMGAGAATVGIDGQVAEGELQRLFRFEHPRTGEHLGQPYKVGGTYLDRFGVTRTKQARAGFDVTFSVPKSVSELYAQTSPEVQAEIKAACEQATSALVDHLDRYASHSRIGKGGPTQVETHGLVVGRFMHRTSRAGDPQLHWHLLVANKVQRVSDGQWRALDGRNLFAEAKTAGMIAHAVMRDELSRRLGVEWEPVSVNGQADIVGVPKELMEFHSKRTAEVEAYAKAKIAEVEQKLGRAVTPMQRGEIYDRAAVATRKVKAKDQEAIEGLAERWQAEAAELGYPGSDWVSDVVGRRVVVEQTTNAEIVAQALTELTAKQSTWTRTEALRAIAKRTTTPGASGSVAERIEQLGEQLIEEAEVVQVAYERDGVAGSERYTTLEVLSREQRILDHVEDNQAGHYGRVTPANIAAAINQQTAEAGDGLDDSQTAAVKDVCGSGDAVSVMIGPAGAGKTRTVATIVDAYQRQGTTVRGFATSTKAVEVLATETGLNVDTIQKLLYEHANGPPDEQWKVRPGDVLILDEASMISTAQLDRLIHIVNEADAKLVMVGDWRQLEAVDAGGMFRLLAQRYGTDLDEIWRFKADWEKQASQLLRSGDPNQAIDAYDQHRRIIGGDQDQLINQAADYWITSHTEGESVVISAATNEVVDDLNAAVRERLHARGHFNPDGGVVTIAGAEYRPGDVIVTQTPQRQLLVTDGGFVTNGARWEITRVYDNGSIIAQRPGQPDSWVTLPSWYTQDTTNDGRPNLRHGYAVTTHKAQGVTVDRAAVIATGTSSRESVYVGATRGREENLILVATDPDNLDEYGLTQGPAANANTVLRSVLSRERGERAAIDHLMSEHGTFAQLPPDLGRDIDLSATPLPRRHLQRLIDQQRDLDLQIALRDHEGLDVDEQQKDLNGVRRQLNADRQARQRQLEAAGTPPGWLTEALGEIPTNTVDREQWYRQAAHLHQQNTLNQNLQRDLEAQRLARQRAMDRSRGRSL